MEKRAHKRIKKCAHSGLLMVQSGDQRWMERDKHKCTCSAPRMVKIPIKGDVVTRKDTTSLLSPKMTWNYWKSEHISIDL